MRFRTTILQTGKTAAGIRGPDFAAALDAEPAARRTFESLSPSNKGWHVSQVEGAKTEETRQRRIEKQVDALREGRAR